MLGPTLCIRIFGFLAVLLVIASATYAEPPAQSVHWGSIAFPDHDLSLTLSTTVVDRFTEFDGEGRRYNDIRETMGFNFFTVSWTQPLARFPG